jgi:hypothetical protein
VLESCQLGGDLRLRLRPHRQQSAAHAVGS